MLINKNPKTDWKKGDICFIHEHWTDNIEKAQIKAIETQNGKTVYHVHCLDTYGDTSRHAEHLFRTKEEGQNAVADKSNEKMAKYEAMMTDVESLIRFAYEHNVHPCEEYTDWEAINAYKNRALALLGIHLD